MTDTPISGLPATVIVGGENVPLVQGGVTRRAPLGSIAPQDAAAVDITGGTIDGTGIGGSTPDDGTFNTLIVNTLARPDADDGAPLGSGLFGFSDLFLASGGVINWANGDVTITQTANMLAFAGASTGYTFDATVQVSGSTASFVACDLVSTEAGAGAGPYLRLDRQSASPAVSDLIGAITFRGRDSAANAQDYAAMAARILDATSGSEDAEIVFSSQFAGSMADIFSIQPGRATIGGVDSISNCTLTMNGPGNCGLEVGRVDGVASTPYLDFHCGASVTDFDARLLISNGTGSDGGGRMVVQAASVRFSGITTTASAANAFLDSGVQNNLLRSTSSIRYKRDVETLAPERSDLALGLRPVSYRSRSANDDPSQLFYGLIAEEVAEVDPRLVHWTYPDEAFAFDEETGERTLKPGAEKIPDGVQYDRVAVLLLEIVKRQQQTIADFERRLSAIEQER